MKNTMPLILFALAFAIRVSADETSANANTQVLHEKIGELEQIIINAQTPVKPTGEKKEKVRKIFTIINGVKLACGYGNENDPNPPKEVDENYYGFKPLNFKKQLNQRGSVGCEKQLAKVDDQIKNIGIPRLALPSALPRPVQEKGNGGLATPNNKPSPGDIGRNNRRKIMEPTPVPRN